VIELSYINSPEIYKLMLVNVFKDISNDPFIYPYKFVGLAVCILNIAAKLTKDVHYTAYASADDLNQCLLLMKNKMDAMLVDTEGTSIQDALDSFNYILMAMTAVGVGGVREEQIAEI
jgi:hypothetical protein